jgi:GNAT superfamily N-acetyltransferase
MNRWVSSPLQPDHDITAFDCGNPTLNTWFQEQSHRAQAAGTARTFVWTLEDSWAVRAYYSIAPTQVVRDELTRAQPGGYSVIPTYLIAWLAVDLSLRGQGLGADLLFDAIEKVVQAATTGGGRLIVVDAIDKEAASFYRHHDFKPVKNNPHRLVMPIPTAHRALGGDTRSAIMDT